MCNTPEEANGEFSYKNEYTLKNGQKLLVRSPKIEDAQGLIDQMKTVDCETKFLSREPGEFSFTLEQEEDFIRNTLKNKYMSFFIGEVDGEIIANCAVGLVMSNRRYLHRATMGIAILKKYWKNGIGKIMMQECINWCKNNGVEQLELDVVTENERAKSMYESLGFQIHGTKKRALKYSDGTYADEYFMILTLDE